MSNMNKLEYLRTQLAEARGQHQASMARQIIAQRSTVTAEQRIKDLERQVRKLEQEGTSAQEVIVTDHAVLRWLERRHGLSMDGVRAEILAEGTESAIKFMGTGKVTKGDFTLVVENRTVITIKPTNKGSATL